MSNLRRYYADGQIYFVTCVTYMRQPLLLENADLFWTSIREYQSKLQFEIQAWVILPDHFHVMIEPKSSDLSEVMRLVKIKTAALHRMKTRTNSGRFWQNRFWDHVIRDQEDWNRHVDYIHYNPVKHGIAKSVIDFPQSSVHEFIKRGYEIPDLRLIPDDEEEFGE